MYAQLVRGLTQGGASVEARWFGIASSGRDRIRVGDDGWGADSACDSVASIPLHALHVRHGPRNRPHSVDRPHHATYDWVGRGNDMAARDRPDRLHPVEHPA